MKKSLLSLAIIPMLLTSCKGNADSLTVISPVGAPTIAFHHLAGKDNFTTTTAPTEVLGTFANEQKDIIIFDAINGLKQITGANKAKYKLAKVITNGNFYIVSNNRDELKPFDETAYIVSFGQNLVPDTIYKRLYPGLASNTRYVNSASDAAAVVCSGLHEGNTVDYVFGAMPSLFQMINKTDCATKGKIEIFKNVQEDFKLLSGFDGIPQAGIFVKNKTYAENKSKVDTLLSDVTRSINSLKTDVASVIDEILGKITAEEMLAKYGFTKASLTGMFADGKNLLGLVDGGVSINDFMETIGQNKFDDDAFLTK